MAARLSGEVALPAVALEVVELGLPLAGALGWVVEQSGLPLGKLVRFLSGVALGVGLGWVLAEHLRSPWPPELIRLGMGLGLALVLGLAARWAAATAGGRDGQEELALPPPEPLEPAGDLDCESRPSREAKDEEMTASPEKGPRHPKMG